MGRPTTYTDEIADEICSRIGEGESLNQICKDDHLPNRSTIHLWVLKDDQFSDKYTRARMLQAEILFEETIEIADDGSQDWVTRTRNDGSEYEAVDSEHIQRSRLRGDTRKWFIGKVAPKIYGDKVSHEHSGPDGGAIKTVQWVVDAGTDHSPT